METLKELIRLVTQKRIKKIELFDEQSRNKASNYFKLFDGIHAQKYDTDEEASSDIYQCPPSEKKYLILKTRLKQKLLNTLFFLEISTSDDISAYDVAKFEASKAMYFYQVLYMHQAQDIAIQAVEKVLDKAQKYKMAEIELNAATLLREYAAKNLRNKDFGYYTQVASLAANKITAENTAIALFQSLDLAYQRAKTHKQELTHQSYQALLTIQDLVEEFDSFLLQVYYYKILTLHYQFNDAFEEVIQTLKMKEEFLKENDLIYTFEMKRSLEIDRMTAYIHLKDTEEGERLMQEVIQENKPTENHWFNMHEKNLMLYMHTGNYLKAAQGFRQVVDQPRFKLLPESSKQRWQTFQAYLNYISKYLKIKEIKALTQNSKIPFKLNEYLVQTPEIDKSLRGMQISQMAIQLMYHLERLDMAGMNHCIDNLQSFCRKYPKKDAHFRSENFINLLTLMRAEDYRYYQTTKATEKIAKELSQTPIEAQNDKTLEVLPYEVMWQMILEKLKTYRYG